MKTLALLLAFSQLLCSCMTATSVYYQPNSNVQGLDDVDHGQSMRIITKDGRKFIMEFISVYDNSVYGYLYESRHGQTRKIRTRINISDIYYVEKLKLDTVKSVAFGALVLLYVVSFGNTFLAEEE